MDDYADEQYKQTGNVAHEVVAVDVPEVRQFGINEKCERQAHGRRHVTYLIQKSERWFGVAHDRPQTTCQR